VGFKMHQPVCEQRILEVHALRMVRMLDRCISEATKPTSYGLSASMLGAYAERLLKMEDELGELLV